MVVLVDYREERSVVVSQLKQMGLPIKIEKLDVGDYIIPSEQGTICIERKEVNDYVESLISGRLHTQLYQMSYNFPFSILIVEGSIEEVLMERKIRREVYISSLAGSLYKRAPDGCQGVINVIMLPNYFDTALFLKYLHEKAENYEPRLPKLKRYKMSEDKFLIQILSVFPNIGEKRAEKLVNRFGSLKNIINASKSELIKVLGPTIGERFYNFINKKYINK